MILYKASWFFRKYLSRNSEPTLFDIFFSLILIFE